MRRVISEDEWWSTCVQLSEENKRLAAQASLVQQFVDGAFDLGVAPSEIAEAAARPRPRIVCLCGSTKFRAAFEATADRETLAGKIVLTVAVFRHDDGRAVVTAEECRLLDKLHLRKIDMADEVLFLNVGGYIGLGGCDELAYAIAQEKKISFLEEPRYFDQKTWSI